MRRIVCFLLMLMLCMLSLLTGCTQSSNTSLAENGTRTVVDMSGNTVAVPASIKKYAVTWTAVTDIVAMFDGCKHMVGYPVTTASYPWFFEVYPEAKSLPTFPKENVSVESVIETGAQVVFLKAADDKNLVTQLKNAGIAVIDVGFFNYDELKDAVRLVANVFGTDEATALADRYCAYVDDEINFAKTFSNNIPEGEKVSALAFRDTSNYTAYGKETLPGLWTNLCGAKYILEDDRNVNLTKEQIAEYNPDYIFFIIPGEAQKMKSDPAFATLNAIKNNRIIENPCGMNSWSNSGSECILQFKWAISVFYPDRVNYDIKDEVRKFYKEFYGYTLTDTEITNITNVSF